MSNDMSDQIGNVFTNVRIAFFAWYKVSQSVTDLGALLQVWMASLTHVFLSQNSWLIDNWR